MKTLFDFRSFAYISVFATLFSFTEMLRASEDWDLPEIIDISPIHNHETAPLRILGRAGDLIIAQSYNLGWFSSSTSFLEAFDISTGELVWSISEVGIIVDFEIIYDAILIYRVRNELKAIDVREGTYFWTVETLGSKS